MNIFKKIAKIAVVAALAAIISAGCSDDDSGGGGKNPANRDDPSDMYKPSSEYQYQFTYGGQGFNVDVNLWELNWDFPSVHKASDITLDVRSGEWDTQCVWDDGGKAYQRNIVMSVGKALEGYDEDWYYNRMMYWCNLGLEPISIPEDCLNYHKGSSDEWNMWKALRGEYSCAEVSRNTGSQEQFTLVITLPAGVFTLYRYWSLISGVNSFINDSNNKYDLAELKEATISFWENVPGVHKIYLTVTLNSLKRSEKLVFITVDAQDPAGWDGGDNPRQITSAFPEDEYDAYKMTCKIGPEKYQIGTEEHERQTWIRSLDEYIHDN